MTLDLIITMSMFLTIIFIGVGCIIAAAFLFWMCLREYEIDDLPPLTNGRRTR